MGSVAITPWMAGLLLVTGVIVSVTDLRERRIYNVVTFPLIALGLIMHALPQPWGIATGDWRVGLWGFLVGLAILFLPFALGVVKAGDVKYLAGVGAVGGPLVALFAFLYGSLVHGLVCLVALARRGETGAAFENIGFWFRNSFLARRPVDFAARSQGQVPYALSLALGCLAALVSVWLTGSVFPLLG